MPYAYCSSEEKIRVMRIFSRLNVGGPSIHVVLLTAELDPARYTSTLVLGKEEVHEGNLHELAQSKNLDPIIVPTLGRSIRPVDDFRSFITICRLIAQHRPHVVHTHTAKAGALGRIAAPLMGVPVTVHTFHGSVFTGYFRKLPAAIYALVERALARVTDAIIAVSPAVAEELAKKRLVPRHGIHTIPLGLELERFGSPEANGRLRARLGLDRNIPLIGCVGRLVPIKDVPTLLSAFARLEGAPAPCMRAHLALIGDGPERERLESLADKLGVASRVHFTGFLSELETVYPDLDLVVNSSRNEGTPVALIEAMAAGIPVVATSVGGSPDLLQGGALGELVPPGEPEALAHALERTLRRQDEIVSRTHAARTAVLEQHRAERLLDDIDTLYSTLLRRKGFAMPPGDRTPIQH
ncbi:MAG: glycosyltransferase family 1 protein [Acidobacteria bacterium]|nr:MAG: glycosyltransferase family 1 protein [Acidobacteriota bacterium]